MMQKIQNFFQEKGQGIVEYGIILAVVVGIAIAVFSDGTGTDLKTKLTGKFNNVAEEINADNGKGIGKTEIKTTP